MNALSTPDARQGRTALPTRGGDMAYLDFGAADRPVDVIFSHANGYNARTYRSILAPLTELRILAVDMRGHGATTLPAIVEGRAGWPEFREDLLAFADAMTDGPVVLAGHSMGGTSSLLAAAARPEKVRALALFDAVLTDFGPGGDNPLADGAERRRADFASRQAAYDAYLGRGGFRTWSPEQLADYVEAGFREAPAGGVTLACRPQWEASNFRTHNYDPWAAFRESRCPVTLLRAETGSTARIADHEAELLASGRVTIETVPGTTHFLPMERPDLVRDTLRVVVGVSG